jgi:hypothetical protein
MPARTKAPFRGVEQARPGMFASVFLPPYGPPAGAGGRSTPITTSLHFAAQSGFARKEELHTRATHKHPVRSAVQRPPAPAGGPEGGP